VSSDLVPAGALVAGGLLTLAGGVLREHFASGREREARNAEREVARDAFQRETLLELQDAILRVVRNTTQLRIHHRTVYADNGTYAREFDPPELSDESRLAMVAATRLRQRVLDDSLRKRAGDVQTLCTHITMPPQLTGETDAEAAERADAQSLQLPQEYNELENHLGRVLRTLL
jgi:hypothetical protein